MTKKYYIDDDENDEVGAVIGVILLLCFIFILAPGVIATSLLHLFIDFSVSQLWGCSIVSSLILVGYMHLFTEDGFSMRDYLIYAGISAAFIIIVTLFVNDNCFFNTVKEMFGAN